MSHGSLMTVPSVNFDALSLIYIAVTVLAPGHWTEPVDNARVLVLTEFQ